MATIAKIKFNGIDRMESMYIGDMPFDKVCRVIEKMIKTNNVVQNAERTELHRIDEINTPTRYCNKTRIYWVVLDGQTMARVIVRDLK